MLALLLVVLCLGAAFATTATAGDAADTAVQSAAPKARAQLTLDSVEPMVVMPRAEVSATASLRNTGTLALTRGEVRLRLSRARLNSRAELAAVAAGRTSSADGQVVARQRLPRRIDRGEQVQVQLSADLSDRARGRDFGVYVLTIEVVAQSRDGFGRVAAIRTFLPWVPAKREFKPAGFTWLWPVNSAPTRRADGVFSDGSLAQAMTDTGRLDRIVTAGESLATQLPMTWVIDPALLEDAQAMTGGYRVAGTGGAAVDGDGAALANAWLGRLRVAAAGQRVISLPYGDVDLVSLRRHRLLADIAAARTRGADVMTTLLGVTPVIDVAWPADGFADRATVSALRGIGYTSIVLDARALAPELPLSYTPTGRGNLRTRNGTMAVLLHDPALTQALAAPETASPVLTTQRFLAETAMITSELPSVGVDRKILVVPPRVWSPSPAFLSQLVDVLPRAPWLAAVPSDAFAMAEPPEIDRKPLRYPRSVRKRELSAPYLAAVRDMNASIEVFSSILPRQPNPLIRRFRAAVYRLESAWWRGRQERVNRLSDERRELAAKRNEVRVQPGNYTFGSGTGIIPLTISNGLSQEVVVDVRLRPKSLLIEIGDVEQQRIAPRSKIQVEVPARARAKGTVLVETSLQTPAGLQFHNPVELRVRVTQYGTVALYITLAAAAVVLLASIIRLTRRGMRHRRRRRRHGRAHPGSTADTRSAASAAT